MENNGDLEIGGEKKNKERKIVCARLVKISRRISGRLVNKITYDCQRSVSKFLNRAGMAGCGADDLLCSQPAMSTIYIQRPAAVVQVGLQCLRNGNGTANDLGFTPWNILTKL